MLFLKGKNNITKDMTVFDHFTLRFIKVRPIFSLVQMYISALYSAILLLQVYNNIDLSILSIQAINDIFCGSPSL